MYQTKRSQRRTDYSPSERSVRIDDPKIKKWTVSHAVFNAPFTPK